MTAVEAQAAGRPVVALAGGGALESVVPGETGLLFPAPTTDALTAALAATTATDWDTELIQANAERFNRARFDKEIEAILSMLPLE